MSRPQTVGSMILKMSGMPCKGLKGHGRLTKLNGYVTSLNAFVLVPLGAVPFLQQFAVESAVGEINDEADGQPDEETNPGFYS